MWATWRTSGYHSGYHTGYCPGRSSDCVCEWVASWRCPRWCVQGVTQGVVQIAVDGPLQVTVRGAVQDPVKGVVQEGFQGKLQRFQCFNASTVTNFEFWILCELVLCMSPDCGRHGLRRTMVCPHRRQRVHFDKGRAQFCGLRAQNQKFFRRSKNGKIKRKLYCTETLLWRRNNSGQKVQALTLKFDSCFCAFEWVEGPVDLWS